MVFGRRRIQEQVGQGSRGLDGRERHLVRHVYVLVVSDGRKDRHAAAGNGHGQGIIVKAGKVQFRAAAAQDEDGIVGRTHPSDGSQRIGDGLRGGGSLHGSRIQIHPIGEPIGIFEQMPAEIAVACRVFGRYHRQRIGQFA